MESVLRDVRHPQVGMLPHHTLLRLGLASEQLDDGGLAGTVGADAGHPGVEAALECDVADDVLVHAGIPVKHQQVCSLSVHRINH